MKGIEERLGDDFCRVHRSTVVNLACVDRTLPSSGGELFLRLKDGTELKCSRMLKDRLLQQLERRAIPAGTPPAGEQARAVDGNVPVA
jgi:DNA-binding LytR/AlgR family response regulator